MRDRYRAGLIGAIYLAVWTPAVWAADIVVVGPMTGRYSAYGDALRAAVASRLPTSEGATHSASKITFEDDACDASKAVETAHRIVTARPDLVIGHPCSSAAVAAAPVYARAGIVFLATFARHADLTDKRAGPTVFRVAGRDDAQGAVAAQYLADVAGSKRIVVLHDRTQHMSRLAKSAIAALQARGGQHTAQASEFPFVASKLDYAALVEQVQAEQRAMGDIGAIFFAGYPQEAILILRQLRARGLTAPWLGSDAVGTSELGASLAQSLEPVRVLMVPGIDAASAIKQQTEAALDIAQAALKTNSVGEVAKSIQTGEWSTPLGRITFDAKGDGRLPSYEVREWRNGLWQPISKTQ